jgi:DNA polymerase-3 subunit delta
MSYKILTDLINKGSLPPCIILYGMEVNLIDKIVEMVKNKYINKDYEDINYNEFEKIENDFNLFYETITTFPFLSDKKVCVVKEADFLTSAGSLNKSDEDRLLNIIDESYDSCILLFLIKSGKPDARKKAVKKLKEKKAVYEINKLNESELNKYISEKFKKADISIGFRDIDYISNNVGYLDYDSQTSLYEVNNEVDKLISYSINDKKINRQDIDNLMIISTEMNIFKLVDYICEGKKDKAYEILDEMLLNNTPEQYIIHMIIRQYRMLYQYILLNNKGYSMDSIMGEMKIKRFVANKLSNLSKKLSLKKIESYMDKFLEIDKNIKTGLIDKRIGLEIIANGMI